MTWNPDVYLTFERERAAPFDDLVAFVRVRPGMTAVDLGCGTGSLTRRLADHLPGSDVLGIDTSPEMLARAEAIARPGLRFERRALEAVTGTWDLVFSHAAIQWVDDHESLVPRLLSLVKPGGQLAVQLPSNHGHVAHTLMAETAGEPPFRDALGQWHRVSPALGIDRYAEILHAHGGTELTVMEKVYPHVLRDADAVVDWTRGTALLPFLERLPEGLREPFVARYRDKLRARMPGAPVFYGFRRTLFVATHGEP